MISMGTFCSSHFSLYRALLSTTRPTRLGEPPPVSLLLWSRGGLVIDIGRIQVGKNSDSLKRISWPAWILEPWILGGWHSYSGKGCTRNSKYHLPILHLALPVTHQRLHSQHTAHLTLPITHWTLHAVHCTCHSAHFTMHTSQCSLHSAHFTVHTSQYTLETTQ